MFISYFVWNFEANIQNSLVFGAKHVINEEKRRFCEGCALSLKANMGANGKMTIYGKVNNREMFLHEISCRVFRLLKSFKKILRVIKNISINFDRIWFDKLH